MEVPTNSVNPYFVDYLSIWIYNKPYSFIFLLFLLILYSKFIPSVITDLHLVGLHSSVVVSGWVKLGGTGIVRQCCEADNRVDGSYASIAHAVHNEAVYLWQCLNHLVK